MDDSESQSDVSKPWVEGDTPVERWCRPRRYLIADGGRPDDGHGPQRDEDPAGTRSDDGSESGSGSRIGARADRLRQMDRRGVARVLATVGGLTALGSLAAPLVSLTQVFEREYTGPVYTDNVALVDGEGEQITADHLDFGEHTTVFPESNPGIPDAPTLLVRFEEGQYGDTTDLEFTVDGYAAYSKVCTHAGCMVDDRDGDILVCPCHAGKFDPLQGAAVTGGPPPRPLPQLPITLAAEGHLIATGDFPEPVGEGGG